MSTALEVSEIKAPPRAVLSLDCGVTLLPRCSPTVNNDTPVERVGGDVRPAPIGNDRDRDLGEDADVDGDGDGDGEIVPSTPRPRDFIREELSP